MYCMFFLLPLTKSTILNSGCCLYSPFGTEALIPPNEKRVSCWQFPAKTLPGIQSSSAQGSCLIKGHTASWGRPFPQVTLLWRTMWTSELPLELAEPTVATTVQFNRPPPNPTSLIPSWLFPEAVSSKAFADKSVSWGTWPVILWREKK